MIQVLLLLLAIIYPFTSAATYGLCEGDCDKDRDCTNGPKLLCADEHKDALKAAGYDERKANCKDSKLAWNYEVCFDRDLIVGGGGGGKSKETVFVNYYLL